MSKMEGYESQNRSHMLERDELKRRVEVNLSRVKFSSSPSFIKDKVVELKNSVKSVEKLDKNILTSLSKYRTLAEFYLTERNAAFDYKVDWRRR